VVFAVVLLGLGFLFRYQLTVTLYENTEELLQAEWASANGFLRIEGGAAAWERDDGDPERQFILGRLRHASVVADGNGTVIEASPAYRSFGTPPVQDFRAMLKAGGIHWRMYAGPNRVNYLVRYGSMEGGDGQRYLLGIGRSMENNEKIIQQFTMNYVILLPVLLLVVSAAVWALAARALRPLNLVAQAAQLITGASLNLRLAPLNTGDELDHLIARFNEMVDRLESNFNQIRRFSIDVSHELRTPLTAVRGELEVALLSAVTAEQYKEAIERSIESIEKMTLVVRSLLHLSQAESGQVKLSLARMDLAELVRQTADQFQIPAEMQGVTLREQMQDGCYVEGDRIQIERMVSNLLSNAIKYTGKGGSVEVSLAQKDGEVQLAVADTGRGIAKEHIPRIFERFYRIQDGEEDPERGLGLGLSFVAWIVRAHEGRIEVESEPGKGSRFVVHLPAAPASRALAPIKAGRADIES
jgi:heavy metal sensor kinase